MSYLSLISPPLMRWGAAAAFLAAVYLGGYYSGHTKATIAADRAALETQIKVLKADAAIQQMANDKANDLISTLRTQANDDNRRILNYEAELAKKLKEPALGKNTNACALDDFDVKRLRGVATTRGGGK